MLLLRQGSSSHGRGKPRDECGRRRSGAYVLTSTTPNETARAIGANNYTAFTGDLLHFLIHGLPGGPELLALPALYDRLVDAARADGRPRPQQLQTNSVDSLALVRNRHDLGSLPEAWLAPDPENDSLTGRSPSREPVPWWESGFRLGPLKTSLIVLEGDGQHAIKKQNVHISVERRDVELPPEIAGWRAEIEAEQNANRDAGRLFRWNGPNYAISNFVISRLGIEEEPVIYINLQNSDYYTFLATQQLDRTMADGSTPRTKYIHSSDVWNLPPFMCSSFGLNVAVVTADEQLIFSRRSSIVGSSPGLWNSSANEALSRTLDAMGRSSPNLHEVARRGVAEELSIEPHEHRIELLAFHIDAATCQWGASFVAFLSHLTAEELVERISRGAPDKWEHEELDFTPFAPESVISYLLRDDRINQWAASAPGLFYMSLIRRFGKIRVERALTKVLADLGG
ncbi:hypothetical protein [Polymorphospora rubra]|uniref:Nudix hydrolase domain-containing protein n=1 Tax=Polymorphospora rubra TaxID=338584 RepID=A0A810N7S6_9ACTN|nr:hypothetical protein [Polymorphospora rubra]BCJ67455.1 hypothetical protein Prubr_44760 [Polymorphospora rubra]